jgi:hypothetical protein
VYWKRDFVGEVLRRATNQRAWTFVRLGERAPADIWLKSRRQAVDWLLSENQRLAEERDARAARDAHLR